ncbi:MAG: outer membrane beta-barrel protein [Pontiellaceae bacterium]|nr:outer membrane beta-barrel protein [Pontiellaceae bacterium]
MSKKTVCLSAVAAMVSLSAFAEQESDVRILNLVRVGYDDNIYQTGNAQDTAEIMEMVNISGTVNFSGRSDAVFSYQPEVRYRFDGDPKGVSYQNAYGRFNHAVSERVYLTLSDRLRYQMRDGQDGLVSTTDQSYLNNDLMAAADIMLSPKGKLKLGAGYELRRWDDDNYGKTLGNNYDHYTVDASLVRVMNQAATSGMVGVNYQTYEYDGSRGSLDFVSLMAGADHTFSANMSGFGRVGATMSTVDTVTGSEDSATPYLDAGVDYSPSEDTGFNASVGYSVANAQNSFFNSQEKLRFGVGVRHDLTSKVSLSSSLAYIMGWYDSDYAASVGVVDVEDQYMLLSVRGSYQINRNNFIELGYEYSDRSADALLTEFDRNRVDLGWRLRL